MSAQIDFIKAVQLWLGVDDDGDPGEKTWKAWRAKTAGAPKSVAPPAPPARLLDPVKFAAFAPKALPGTCEALEAAAQAFGFRGLVLAHWLGQMDVESRGFSVMEESLNYSVEGLLKAFGRHRISEADARKFGRVDRVVNGKKTTVRPAHQNAIANIVYGGAWGLKNLGNTEPGDGWAKRGSGFKQITGRANEKESGFTMEELRTDVRKSAHAAANFFIQHGCAVPALKDDVEGVTLKVNGGLNGLDARIASTAKAKRMLGL